METTAPSQISYLIPYIPIGMVIVLAAGFGLVNLLLGSLIGPKRANPSKFLAYESGIEPFGPANIRISVKFYMVGLVFLLFDVETVFLLVWAVTLRGTGIDFDSPAIGFTIEQFRMFAFFEMLVFIAILAFGYIYVWRKGGLTWT